MLLTDDIRDYAERSVLCWLATYGEDRIIIANIASPQSVKNIRHQPRVCVRCG